MNILLIGFRYAEIEKIQDCLLAEFSQLKVDFAISVRDSWYRFKISSYDLIILDTTSSETDFIVTHDEVTLRSEGIPIVLLLAETEIAKLSQLNGKRPKYVVVKDQDYIDKVISLLKKGDEKQETLDLHRHIQMKVNLQQALKLLTTSLNMNDDPLYIVNKNFEIIEVNNAFLEEFNLSRKDILGTKCYEALHQFDKACKAEEWTCPLNEVLRLGVAYKATTEKLAHIFPGSAKVKVQAIPISNAVSQIEQVMISYHKEKPVNKVAAQSVFDRNLLELMLSGLSDGLVFCNAEEKIILMNPSAEDILGQPRANIIGKSIFELSLGNGSTWLAEVLKGLKANVRFSSMAFKTKINDQLIQIRFAPIYGPEKFYLGGFLYLTEVDQAAKTFEPATIAPLEEKFYSLEQLIPPKIIAEG